MNVGSTFQVTPSQPSPSCIPVLLRLRQVTPSLLSLHSTFSPDPSFRAWTDSSSSHTVLVQMRLVNGVWYELRSRNQCLPIHCVCRMVPSYWSFSSATLVICASMRSTSAIGYNITLWANFSLHSVRRKHISSNRLIHRSTRLSATNYVRFANGSIWHILIRSFTDHLNLLPSTVRKPKIVSLRSTGTFSSQILKCSTTPFCNLMSHLIPSMLTAVRTYNFTMPPYIVNSFLRHHRILIHQVCIQTNDKRSLFSWLPPQFYIFTHLLSASLRYDMLQLHYLCCLAGKSVKCPFWNMVLLPVNLFCWVNSHLACDSASSSIVFGPFKGVWTPY